MKNFVSFLRQEFKIRKRTSKGLTIAKLADKAGIHRVSFLRMENRINGSLRLKSFLKIAKALDMKGWQLLRRYEEWK